MSFFWGSGAGRRLLNLSAPKANVIRPRPALGGSLKRGEGAARAMVAIALVTIHSNPGPIGTLHDTFKRPARAVRQVSEET